MSHQWNPEDLSAYLDGELDEASRTALTAHLESCPACRETLAGFARASARLRETKGTYLAESFVFSVRAKIRSGSDEAVSWIPAERVARRLVLALALLVVAVTGSFWNGEEPVPGIVERYYSTAQQDSVLNQLLSAEAAATKEDVLLAVMAK